MDMLFFLPCPQQVLLKVFYSFMYVFFKSGYNSGKYSDEDEMRSGMFTLLPLFVYLLCPS